MIYCFDIDETICTKVLDGDYLKAKPYKNRIKKINKLYEDGNKIIFLTARGFVTKINWKETTENQLLHWGVKYHELFLTKPYADIYIDDKGISDHDFFDK
jgi:CMP-N,N'-diacetyllegionaminic acid synthase